jgi:hypothetical protein
LEERSDDTDRLPVLHVFSTIYERSSTHFLSFHLDLPQMSSRKTLQISSTVKTYASGYLLNFEQAAVDLDYHFRLRHFLAPYLDVNSEMVSGTPNFADNDASTGTLWVALSFPLTFFAAFIVGVRVWWRYSQTGTIGKADWCVVGALVSWVEYLLMR